METIDKYGLKKRNLKKHNKDVENFYNLINEKTFHSENALKFIQRFQKYRDKLFTFIDYDGVPWNNNNAEHAIKLLATHTNKQIRLFSAARIDDYLKIMSIYQTCIYNNISFLKFLLSREKDIDAFLNNSTVKSFH